MSQRPRPPRHFPLEPIDPEGWDKDPGRPLGLRLLALSAPSPSWPWASAASCPSCSAKAPFPRTTAPRLSRSLEHHRLCQQVPSNPALSSTPPALPQPNQPPSPQNRQGPAKDAPLLGRRKDQARPLRGPCNSLRGEAQKRCPTPFLPWRSARPPAAKSVPW